MTCDTNEASCDNVCDSGRDALVDCKRTLPHLVVLLLR